MFEIEVFNALQTRFGPSKYTSLRTTLQKRNPKLKMKTPLEVPDIIGLAQELIHSPHLLVLATSEQFLPAGGTFRAILASESHWLQPVLVLSARSGVRWLILKSSRCARNMIHAQV